MICLALTLTLNDLCHYVIQLASYCCLLKYNIIIVTLLIYIYVSSTLTGPGRSTLQAMLANLGNEDDIPSVQAGAAASSPARSTVSGNSMPDIDDMGMHG